MRFRNRLGNQKTEEPETIGQQDALVESVRTHVLPAFIEKGFAVTPRNPRRVSMDSEHSEIFPLGEMRRARLDGGVDLAEIQFKIRQHGAFRINACAVPREGMMTAGGHRNADELHAGGLHDHFETHARPWLRPSLRKLRIEPLGEWFSVWHWPGRSPTKRDCDKLAIRVAKLVPEIDLALREGKLGPHMRHVKISPPPPEVLERIQRLQNRAMEE